MFGTIRKHQTWLWAVIITLTVISFVIYFSPYSRMNSGARNRDANLGSINGERITASEFIDAKREVILRYFLNTSRWPDKNAQRSRFDPDQETYGWLIILRKQKEMGIQVSEDVAAAL